MHETGLVRSGSTSRLGDGAFCNAISLTSVATTVNSMHMGTVERPNGNWNVEVGILEIYQCYPLPRLEGGPYCLWCFHFEFLCLQKVGQGTELQDRSPAVVGFGKQEKSVVKPKRFLSYDWFYCIILHANHIHLCTYPLMMVGVTFSGEYYDLWTCPQGCRYFPKLVQSGPYRCIWSKNWDICDIWVKTQVAYIGNIFHIFL